MLNLVSVGIFGQLFGWIGDLMINALNFFYGFTNSYGLSIFLLTLAVRIILFPLVAKQTRSMKKMQELQPKMEELKKKYEDEPQEFQKKMQELYVENKVNPAAGCLPLLVQMPILIALFRVLQSFEPLKGTSFLWISDLAQPDIILVILTGLIMLGQTQMQQRMSGNAAANNKMMLFMPLLIVVIGFRLPAGVLVYWFTSNLVMVVQQYFLYQEPATIKGESN
ncbi:MULTISPECIES: YidC/Oxa1 family membrane protein insertase [unclassified Candidatus Frackibacter]|uniref:YidC/Oxa1 family membrane protein insertase n=1 Tax=unclassified Candidatus Frackibacter TaxID=2648818 RepID=UPI000797C91E|nr:MULTISPECIES: YidC/Oxa1 family membrane protein insertase [unclassified Candidatus Frackibacter]KXS44074.1 MAG: preprotein translocase subunit YidC [Candidatus Frackibacter sp. T328-2]